MSHEVTWIVAVASLAALSLPTCVVADTFGVGSHQFTIDFVHVGNPGNAPDLTGNPTPAGAVAYEFRMGRYEISREIVSKASIAGNLGLTLDVMEFIPGGPRPTIPATGVSWNGAARFVNWLNTSKGFPPAYKFSTQPGGVGYLPDQNILLWDATEPGFDAANPFRNSLAHYFLPSTNEWYKSAFYSPQSATYFDYPTGSDERPMAVMSGTDAGTAVFDLSDEIGPADSTQAGGLSPYGVMGQAGNVFEFQETPYNLGSTDPVSTRSIARRLLEIARLRLR